MQVPSALLCARSGQRIFNYILHLNIYSSRIQRIAPIHTTSCKLNLMEFFDSPKNWGKTEVRCGRSWKVDELRIKSNEDLHKLWYILLKEKNMLLTMEHYCTENYVVFPSPERIDKVEDSMKNLETVVRERNKAYYMLETGEEGEQPGAMIHSAIGLPYYHKMTQHTIPKYRNKWFKENFFHGYDYNEARDFLSKWREKKRGKDYAAIQSETKYVQGLMKRFRNMDEEALKKQFPRVDIDALKKDPNNTRGHWEP